MKAIRYRAAIAVAVSALVLVAGQPARATSSPRPAPVRTITTGLDGPYGLDVGPAPAALVSEADSGQVTEVDLGSGKQRTILSGLAGPAGVAAHGDKIYVVQGGGGEGGAPVPPSKFPPSALLVADRNTKQVRVLADLLKYELKSNPDRQAQFDKDGKPYDALSNPFSLAYTKWGLLIADGGANDVLRVDPDTGRISTFFVPPNPRTRECLGKDAQANPGTVGCDPVPTGVTVQGRFVYVSTLGAERPGAAAIWKLDGRTGRVLRMWTGFTALTGIAVAPGGALYASEVLFNAPAGGGPPPPGFDPATVGRITRVDHGRVTYAAVTMPTGLAFVDGRLFATSWSIASLLGVKSAGRVVEVDPGAFR
jgi:DNA-binding beta-propeller fold protein YncE